MINLLSRITAYSSIALTRPQTISKFYKLKEAQYWNTEKLLLHKERLLKGMIEYAFLQTPYYRTILRGFDELWQRDRFDWELYAKLPVLTKQDVKDYFEDLKSREIHRMKTRTNRSGGSTGQPTVHIQEEYFRQMDMANNMLFKSWQNIGPGCNSLFVAADERDYFGEPVDIKRKIVDAIFNKHYFNAFRLNEDTFSKMVFHINREKPEYIQMYMSAAFEFSRYVVRKKIKLHPPKMVMCVAGTTHDDMLDVIEEAFQTKVNARYGSRETGDMAGMCTNRIYHEIPFTHHIDILDEDDNPVSESVPGHIAVTILTNRALPIIRYKIGDMGIWANHSCSCGVKFRAIKKIVGRTGEVIRNEKGKIILPEIFIHLVGVALGKLSDDIQTFQVAQTQIKKLEVRLVLRNGVNPEAFLPSMRSLEQKIQSIMEDDSTIETVFLDNIPRLPSGKYAYTLSDVN